MPRVLERIVKELDPRRDFDRIKSSPSVLNYATAIVKPLLRGGAAGYLATLLAAKVIGAEEAYATLLHPSLESHTAYFLPVALGSLLDYAQTILRSLSFEAAS